MSRQWQGPSKGLLKVFRVEELWLVKLWNSPKTLSLSRSKKQHFIIPALLAVAQEKKLLLLFYRLLNLSTTRQLILQRALAKFRQSRLEKCDDAFLPAGFRSDFQSSLLFTQTRTSVLPCLQSLSVLQGVNVKLSKLDETLWEILWGSLLVWWLGVSG